jgi:ribonuclease HI
MRPKEIVTDSYSKGDFEVAGIGVAYRGSRIICGDIVEASDLLGAELLAVLRAVEIASNHKACSSVIYTDHGFASELVGNGHSRYFNPLLAEIHERLEQNPQISVEWMSWEGVQSARIVARQIFKAWRCSFNDGVTWRVPSLRDPAEGPAAVAA